MRTFFITFSFVILSASIFIACRKSSPNDEVIGQIAKNDLSALSNKLGLNSINIIATNDSQSQNYSLSGKKMIINDFLVVFSKIRLSINENYSGYDLALSVGKKVLKYSLDKGTKKAFKIIAERKVPVEKLLSNKREELYFLVAMTIFSETQINSRRLYANNSMSTFGDNQGLPVVRFARNDGGPAVAACERTVASIHYTNSAATSGVNAATDRFLREHPDCKRKNGVDSGCLWGGYGCVATQSITCTGGGCDVPYGAFDTEYPDTIPGPVDTTYDEPTPQIL